MQYNLSNGICHGLVTVLFAVATVNRSITSIRFRNLLTFLFNYAFRPI